jgi:anti-sigma factor ChrR (cupin superfamily)
MRINADFRRRVVETPATAQWRPSPAPGVERRMLDRIGDEVAVATSVVRYAPGSHFPVHLHEKGEEFFVLDGVFSDAAGDYARGTYVRNPPGTSHAPWTDAGTTILVKLRQFDMADLRQFSLDTSVAAWSDGPIPGTRVLPLHEFNTECVRMITMDAGTTMAAREIPFGEEIYVVEGQIKDAEGSYDADTWIRNPAGTAAAFEATRNSVLWMKTGHLHPEFGAEKRQLLPLTQ